MQLQQQAARGVALAHSNRVVATGAIVIRPLVFVVRVVIRRVAIMVRRGCCRRGASRVLACASSSTTTRTANDAIQS